MYYSIHKSLHTRFYLDLRNIYRNFLKGRGRLRNIYRNLGESLGANMDTARSKIAD